MNLQLTYQPGETLLHQLHPLLKLGWGAMLTSLVFIVQVPWFTLLLTVVLFMILSLLNSRFYQLRRFRLLLFTALMIALLQVIFLDSGSALVQIGPLSVTELGLIRGVHLGARFLAVIFISYLFVLTTSPNQLAYALMRAGLPYRFGFTLVTAMRLIPIFEQESLTVYRAQLVRGVSYDRKHISTLLKFFRSLLLPMLISAMSKVDAMSLSMEGRSFGRYPKRTYFRTWQTGRWDRVFGWGLGLIVIITAWIILEVKH